MVCWILVVVNVQGAAVQPNDDQETVHGAQPAGQAVFVSTLTGDEHILNLFTRARTGHQLSESLRAIRWMDLSQPPGSAVGVSMWSDSTCIFTAGNFSDDDIKGWVVLSWEKTIEWLNASAATGPSSLPECKYPRHNVGTLVEKGYDLFQPVRHGDRLR